MKITYYGHSCFGVEVGGKHLLFDPFITANGLAKQIRADQIPADYILLSHAHEDHVADAVSIAKRTQAKVLSNYEIYLWLTRQGIKEALPMNLGGTAKLEGGGMQATLVPALHSSSLPDGTYGGTAGGWVVRTTEGSFYYSGDTALMTDMKLIGSSTKLKWAALCVGDTFTMGVEDAIQAAEYVGCDQVLGVHYDTFPPIQIDHAEAKRKFRGAGRTLYLPPIGGSLEL
ncbi:MAG: metal-dependent hydrolase [Verrucomicrobia bacterium]|nr:metal-dependent hydrolase [Verrucomicrobiota bacterium]